jgi:hypothetical protein
MHESSRLIFAITVTLATVVVCTLGIRAELASANQSLKDRWHWKTPGEDARALHAARDEEPRPSPEQ